MAPFTCRADLSVQSQRKSDQPGACRGGIIGRNIAVWRRAPSGVGPPFGLPEAVQSISLVSDDKYFKGDPNIVGMHGRIRSGEIVNRLSRKNGPFYLSRRPQCAGSTQI